ncbi:hypothetical protein TWF718_000617 [Orbilia javanica]|uniref:CBM-cenC domain-containing protein n=1 Tax=Orbilia javanica TaxID=47235 RepID=A0AAN8P1D8_9PEZI
MKFDISLLLGLSFSISVAAYEPVYLQRWTCSQNNLYRTLERLQRESSFCQALLVPNPTVTVPSSIAATPIATISSACNCIVATLTTSTTSTTTTSSVSVCANTITITANPVTVTEKPDPVTVTETYTPTSPPTEVATAYDFDFETLDGLWGCSTKIQGNRDFAGCGIHEDPTAAHSGNSFFRLSYWSGDGEAVFRFGNIKALSILPNFDYEFSLWYRQFTYTKSICTVVVYFGDAGLSGIGAPGTVSSGWGIGSFSPTTSLTWTKSSTRFNSNRYQSLGMFIAVTCNCPSGESCGNTYVGFDDFVLKPVVPV